MGGDDYFPILASFFFSRYWPTIRLDIVLTPQVLPKVLLQAASTCLDLPLNSQSHIVKNVEGRCSTLEILLMIVIITLFTWSLFVSRMVTLDI